MPTKRQPGRKNSSPATQTHEGRQSAKVGQAVKKVYTDTLKPGVDKAVAQNNSTNKLVDMEKKMSISSSKERESGKGSIRGPVKPPKKR